ncbi:hypothetical protein D8674_023160 [Pyrus ussuriensis x Pyrus communis]|uniref:Uncharacterized protein n=1 Tax=Pyrus ussuriensis x Pyrus communis TaxID=2448454 RepID=A0A5N5GSE8_9ROSA|nr:hypothetical protein D8674_023160 [Pyrus ussuriensis x Pyrus communis]
MAYNCHLARAHVRQLHPTSQNIARVLLINANHPTPTAHLPFLVRRFSSEDLQQIAQGFPVSLRCHESQVEEEEDEEVEEEAPKDEAEIQVRAAAACSCSHGGSRVLLDFVRLSGLFRINVKPLAFLSVYLCCIS